jgi:hypothetical protein
MNDDGLTRRLSVSTAFLWTIATISILVLLAFGILAYVSTSLMIDYGSLKDEHEYAIRHYEALEFSRSVSQAPEEARAILERLDRAILSAEGTDNDIPLPGGAPEESGEAVSPSAPLGPAPAEEPNGSPGEAGGANGEAGGEGDAGGPASAEALSPENSAWDAFHKRLTPPAAPPNLDVDEFRLESDGVFSYYLKKEAEPGVRLRGRAVAVFAVRDASGAVELVSFPKIDLSKPSQGYDLGGKYNIIASKAYRGQVPVPPGGAVLSVEVLAWEEDSKALVFMKKVDLGGE